MSAIHSISPVYSPTFYPINSSREKESELATKLQEAIYACDLDELSSLIQQGANPNQQTALTESLLNYIENHDFAREAVEEIFEKLAEKPQAGLMDILKEEWEEIEGLKEDIERSEGLKAIALIMIGAFRTKSESIRSLEQKINSLGNTQSNSTAQLKKVLEDFYISECLGISKGESVIEIEGGDPVVKTLCDSLPFIPAFLIPVMDGDLSLLNQMIENGAQVQNYDFHGTSNKDDSDESYRLINLVDDNSVPILELLLEKGCSFERLIKVDYDFFYYLADRNPENLDQIFAFLNQYFDYKLLLRENENGENDLIKILSHLLKRSDNVNLKVLLHLIVKFPNYARHNPEIKLNGSFVFESDPWLFSDTKGSRTMVLGKGLLHALKDYDWIEINYEKFKTLFQAGFEFKNLFFCSEDRDLFKGSVLFDFAAFAVFKQDYELLNHLHQKGFDFNKPVYYRTCWGSESDKSKPRTLLGLVLNAENEVDIDTKMCRYLVEKGATSENLNEKLSLRYKEVLNKSV